MESWYIKMQIRIYKREMSSLEGEEGKTLTYLQNIQQTAPLSRMTMHDQLG